MNIGMKRPEGRTAGPRAGRVVPRRPLGGPLWLAVLLAMCALGEARAQDAEGRFESRFTLLEERIESVRTDVQTLRTEVRTLRGRVDWLSEKIDTNIAALNEKIDTNTAALNEKIDTNTAALHGRIDSLGDSLGERIDILTWAIGMATAFFALIFAVFPFYFQIVQNRYPARAAVGSGGGAASGPYRAGATDSNYGGVGDKPGGKRRA